MLKKIKLSKINISIIVTIVIIFTYLLYLSFPSFYKDELHKKLVNDLKNSTNIKFSLPKDIKYSILPKPHFIYSNVKILNEKSQISNFSEIKRLKIFISQKKLLDKSKIKINYIDIDKANFYFNDDNVDYVNFFFNSKLKKKINIRRSNLFYKNREKELVSLLNLKNSKFIYDSKTNQNIIEIKGEIFNTPIKIISEINFNLKKNKTNIEFKELNLNINNLSNYSKDYFSLNEISSFRTKFNSEININSKKLSIMSKESSFQNIPLNYNFDIELNPFFFDISIIFNKLDLKKMKFSIVVEEILKNFILGNEKLNGNLKFNIKNVDKNKLIDDALLNLNFNSGNINLVNSKFNIKKIGSLEIISNNFSLKNGNLFFQAKYNLKIKNQKNFFKRFLIPKDERRKIDNIIFDLIYIIDEDQYYIKEAIVNNNKKNKIDLEHIEIDNWINLVKVVKKIMSSYSG